MRPIILWEEFQCNCFSLTQLFFLVTSCTTYSLPRKRAGRAARGSRLQDLPDHPTATGFNTAVTLSHLTETVRFRPTKKGLSSGLKKRGSSRSFQKASSPCSEKNDKLSPLGTHRKEGCWLRTGCLHWAHLYTASNFTGEVSRQSLGWPCLIVMDGTVLSHSLTPLLVALLDLFVAAVH